MRTIHKHRLSIIGGNIDSILTHKGARVLHVAAQRRGTAEIPMVWLEVDSDAPTAWLDIRSVHTGVVVQGDAEYVGTVLLDGGSHVTHYYRMPQ
jgi:predicted NUDIX family NTP pyrophosphohydrolase